VNKQGIAQLTNEETYDEVIVLGNSVVQHGRGSDRVYLMRMHHADYPGIVDRILELARTRNYGRIVAKIPESACTEFAGRGFIREADIADYYVNSESAVFMALFRDQQRALLHPALQQQVTDILELAAGKGRQAWKQDVPTEFLFRRINTEETETLAELFRQVFASYPFPVFDPAFLMSMIEEDGVSYYGAYSKDGKLIAASSAEMDKENSAVEMTDFATLPAARGHGLALHLLHHMERDMRERGFRTFFTIARALSEGMNVTFAKAGYSATGTLVNSTNIAGAIESMNVWHKKAHLI
jgi:beta-lysine N6-acetyltransferase